MTSTESRLVQEVARLGGHYAHAHDESISPKHDDAAGEAWLHGCFTYMVYRRPLEFRQTSSFSNTSGSNIPALP